MDWLGLLAALQVVGLVSCRCILFVTQGCIPVCNWYWALLLRAFKKVLKERMGQLRFWAILLRAFIYKESRSCRVWKGIVIYACLRTPLALEIWLWATLMSLLIFFRYLSLDPNERSGHQARELKSIYVDSPAAIVRLVLHNCYTNKLNCYNQVSFLQKPVTILCILTYTLLQV